MEKRKYKQVERHSAKESSTSNEFTFLSLKHDCNRQFFNSEYARHLVTNTEDFWRFVKKYEDTLKKSGKSVLESADAISSKIDCVNYKFPGKLKTFLEDILRRSILPKQASCSAVAKMFANVIVFYLDFKNKEKMTRLRKMRKAQSELPIVKYKSQILQNVTDGRVLIIAGDTGCGKSTQVPQFLRDSGIESVACTQPRRIACVSLAKRVALESLSQYGTEVGYQIRFERSKNKDTKICFITEGLLLRQVSSEPKLSQYDVIIVDEVHERSIQVDTLLGVMKCLIRARPDLRLVLMSATANVNLFRDFFRDEGAALVSVEGRLFPIELHYKPPIEENDTGKVDPQPYVQILQLIDKKFTRDQRGDVLIFLQGVLEIETLCSAIQQYCDSSKSEKQWIVLPLHGQLSMAEQDKVFDYAPDNTRKCIVSTNIAETSVTIDGIRFVIDSGKMKEMRYESSCGVRRLKEMWISKANADQRKGRAGRTGPGVCYRLYSESQYQKFPTFSQPEILRTPLSGVLLQLGSLGLPDVRRFPFVEAPSDENIENALMQLKQHGALTNNEKITKLGAALAKLPIEVAVGKLLIIGAIDGAHAVLALGALLGVQEPYTSRGRKDIECELARRPLESDYGDPLTLLALYSTWLDLKVNRENTRAWCVRRGLEEQRFYEATKLSGQFRDLLQDCGIVEKVDEHISSHERALRHGQLKQLKDLRRKHKNDSFEDVRKRKRLKIQSWDQHGLNESVDDSVVDIRDVEFHLANDAHKLQKMISAGSQSLMYLKLSLCRALYPQFAIPDQYNHSKSVLEHVYHTNTKPFIFIHPRSVFFTKSNVLNLNDDEIERSVAPFRTSLTLSKKHQILSYVSILETSKPYLVGCVRIPAASTILLLATHIHTNADFTRLACDSWVLLEFPDPEKSLKMLLTASKLRKRWDKAINELLEDAHFEDKADEENEEPKSKPSPKKSSNEVKRRNARLIKDLNDYINHCEAACTLKRLLPIDLKHLYKGTEESVGFDAALNPFDKDFVPEANEVTGGVWLTERIIYNSVAETEWTCQVQETTTQTLYTCEDCGVAFYMTTMDRLQHRELACSNKSASKPLPEEKSEPAPSMSRNTVTFTCSNCNTVLNCKPIDILRHKNQCKK